LPHEDRGGLFASTPRAERVVRLQLRADVAPQTAAHELKTPLALIRAQIELTVDGDDRRSLLNDVEHMTRQVQPLLLLAEASERQNYTFTAVDVQDVVKEAASYLQRKADAAGVRLVMPDNTAEARWSADRGALFTLLKNLLENAIQHAPRGTDL
jgi:two-component system, OmpR family, sensor histidine kinase QseC